MALIIAGERSGVGKTTVTLSLLASLCRRSQEVQSFKVGPDYIDPMFHEQVTGRPCRNLDPVITSPAYVQQSFARHTQGVEYALVEGVMGLFDGATGKDSTASTAGVARLLDLPILLVLDCSRLSRSVAAIAHGYRSFDPQLKIAGVVLNRVGSDRHLQLLQDALETINVPVLGVLRRQDNIAIPDRHLGLVPTAELTQFPTLLNQFAHLGDTCFDWQHLLPLLKPNPPACISPTPPLPSYSLRIAVARDRAFNFYYPDNLEVLRDLGAELVYWSPLSDSGFPEKVQGLYFGGGFPEVFAQQLMENKPVRESVRQSLQAGMPTYAECGGLMYLCQEIRDFEQQSWSMVGIIPAVAEMSPRLTLGYRRAEALQNSPIVNAGAVLWGHEFHRSRLSATPTQPLFQTRGYDPQSQATVEGWQLHQIHASYIHLHFGAHREIPTRFLQHCASFTSSGHS